MFRWSFIYSISSYKNITLISSIKMREVADFSLIVTRCWTLSRQIRPGRDDEPLRSPDAQHWCKSRHDWWSQGDGQHSEIQEAWQLQDSLPCKGTRQVESDEWQCGLYRVSFVKKSYISKVILLLPKEELTPGRPLQTLKRTSCR